MRAIWDLLIPSATAGSDPFVSPLLGDVTGLPRHSIFVAGQDPLRDEGLAYARKLTNNGVPVQLYVYQGVPHTFAELWELEATQRFWRDLRSAVADWLA
jgi:acetyl esterase/lipase